MFNFIKNIKNKKVLAFIISVLIIIPMSVVMAYELRMQTAWPVSPMTQINLNDTDKQTITHLIAYLYEWGIALGGLAAFVALLIAGFMYLTSVGDPTKMKEAMDRIKSAFLGLTLLLSSWLILHTINPDLTTLRPINFEVGTALTITGIDPDGIGTPKPCKRVVVFEDIDFGERFETIKPGEHGIIPWGLDGWAGPEPFIGIPKSYIMCREVQCRKPRCRPIMENETANALCPTGQTIINTDEKNKIDTEGCGPYRVPAEAIDDENDRCRIHAEINPLPDGWGAYHVEGGLCEVQFFDDGTFAAFWGCSDHIVTLRSPYRRNLSGIDRLGETSCVEVFNPM